MESTPGEDAAKIVEMTSKYSGYYISLVDKAAVGEKIDSNLVRNSTEGKMLSNSITGHRERKNQSMQKTSLLSYLKKLSQPPQSSATTILMSQQPSTLKLIF